jgi:raffinose/stachyose/melibiose transport system substrate-binding protein
MKLCGTIQGSGITPLYEGINGVWHTQSWFYGLTPAIIAEKPDYVDYLDSSKDNKWADIKAVKEGLTQIRDLLSHQPAYFTNDGQSEDWFGSYDALTNRKCAMMFTYSAYAGELAAKGSKDTWGMFPAPMLDNTVAISNGGGISKFINKNSKNIDASKALLNFLAQSENLETYYAARTDLVSSAFKDVKSVSATTATKEMLERTTSEPPVMAMRDVNYWDPNIYKYMQGFASGKTSVDDFIKSIDDYRATMFDTAAASDSE